MKKSQMYYEEIHSQVAELEGVYLHETGKVTGAGGEGWYAKRDEVVALVTALIEQERERAVEELHNFVRSNTIGGRFMNDSGGYFNADAVLREDIEQHLAERRS